MNRLDRHIQNVRNKLAMSLFLQALAWTTLLLAVLLWLAIIGQRTLDRTVPHGRRWFWAGLAASAAAALGYAIARRPTPQTAAVAIDQALGLKERFSTALYARDSSDEFARAAVGDAELSAQRVSLHRQFSLRFPRPAFGALAVFLAALLTALLMPTLHLFQSSAQAANQRPTTMPSAVQEHFLKEQLPTIQEAAHLLNADDNIRKANADLNNAMRTKEGDEAHNQRGMLAALDNYRKALNEQLQKNEEFQTAQSEKEAMSQMNGADDSTPMGKAQNALKAGDPDEAMQQLAKAVDDFNNMKPEDQQKMINQAKSLANQLAQAGHDPHVGQKIIQQLMQMGATQAQAQEMSAAMQRAAAGDPQARQQLGNLAQQMAKNMNNGQGPTQQQKKQIQQMMAKAQGLANSQALAQAMAQNAQQLSQAMSQAQKSGRGQQGQNGQQPQPGQGQGTQAMRDAQQNLSQQLQKMDAQAKDAQEMQAAADAAAQAAGDAAAGIDASSSGQGGRQNDSSSGPSGSNQPQQPNQGQLGNNPPGQGGQGAGGAKMPITQAPFTVKQEIDPSQDISTGKILASRLVKAGIDPGKSQAELRDIAKSAEADAPDEVDQDHVSRDAQQAVKEYFSSMQHNDNSDGN